LASGSFNLPTAEHFPADQFGLKSAQISKAALTVLKNLRRHGYDSYLVGGCVRDLLLGLEPKDFDVATNASPEEIRAIFRSARIIGRRFRLVHVRFGREVIEVATYRGHPGSKVNDEGRLLSDNVYGTRDEDAARRDLPVNALYYDPAENEVLDYHHALDDINAGMLRTIGEPAVRFREDPVRMLRVIRFSAKLGFQIEAQTAAAIDELAYLLEDVPPARLFEEVLKLFHSGSAVTTFERLRQHDLFGYLFPDTEAVLATLDHDFPRTFLPLALKNTDKRIAAGKPVIPSFLFAVLLWEPYHKQRQVYIQQNIGDYESIHMAANDVIEQQIRTVAIPRRFTAQVREIWEMQYFFDMRRKRQAYRLIDNRKFRAGYDFLLLRASVGQAEQVIADWWTRLQDQDEAGRRQTINQLSGGASRRRKRRPRTRPSS
jgi:poly(A) polymerase